MMNFGLVASGPDRSWLNADMHSSATGILIYIYRLVDMLFMLWECRNTPIDPTKSKALVLISTACNGSTYRHIGVW